jgi:hypothetical protein
MRAWWSIPFLILLLQPAAAVGDHPMPPGHLDAEREIQPQGSINVYLTWEAPADSGSSPLDKYLIFRYEQGMNLLGIPPNAFEVDATETEYVDAGVISDRTYLYYVVAVNEDGHQSLPSEITTASPYPSCDPYGYSLSPPDYRITPQCLIP